MVVLVLTLPFIQSILSPTQEVPLIISPGLDGIATVTPEYNVFIDPSCIVDANTTYTDVVRLQCPENYTDQIGIANLTLTPDQIYEFQIFVIYSDEKIVLHHYRDGAIVENKTFTLYSGTEAIMGISIMSTVTQLGAMDPITYEIVCSYGARDIAVMSVAPSKTEVYVGETVEIAVVVRNLGTETETFTVTAYYGCTGIAIGTITVSNLSPYSDTTLMFSWDTTDVTPCAAVPYTIWAVASEVPGETNTANNIYIDGEVKVKIKGDINGDGIVNILDAILLAGAFGSTPEDPNWNQRCDINSDNVVNILDAIMLGRNFGRTDEIIQVIDHVVVWGERTFHVATESDSTVSNFAFSQPDKKISFDASGLCGASAFCKVTIPNDLLRGPYTVLIDGVEVTYSIWGNLTHTSVQFTYAFPPSIRHVEIIGTTVISGSAEARENITAATSPDTFLSLTLVTFRNSYGLVSYLHVEDISRNLIIDLGLTYTAEVRKERRF